jgi:hypothetical protein
MDQESGEFRKIHGVSELFHSGVDDMMLRTRASRMKNYVSIVTDIDNISCYVMHRRKPKKIKENLVNNIDFADHMRPINSKVQLIFDKIFQRDQGLGNMVRTIEQKLVSNMVSDLGEEDVQIQRGPIGNVMRILPLEPDSSASAGDGKGNFLRITPGEKNVNIRAVMNLTPTIYVPKGYIDQKAAVESIKNEIADYIVYLTWNEIDYSDFEKHLSPEIKELEVHLGRITTKSSETSDLPVKVYTRPKRRMTLKKN